MVEHELWVYPVDGGARQPLLGRRDGGVSNLYFMESAGYVLARHGRDVARRLFPARRIGPEPRAQSRPTSSALQAQLGSLKDVPDEVRRAAFEPVDGELSLREEHREVVELFRADLRRAPSTRSIPTGGSTAGGERGRILLQACGASATR